MKITDFNALLGAGSLEESHAPAALNGRELQDLVSPISSEEFVDTYFSRASLNTKGHPGKFDHIFSWGKLKQALVRGQKVSDSRYNITASFTGGEDSGNPRDLIKAQHEKVIELLNAGATVCITNIHMADPFLARWAQMALEAINKDALTVSWMNSLTNNPYTGWQPAPMVPLPEITRDQRFCIAKSSLRFVEFRDKVIVPCDHGVLRFPVTLSPILQRLSSAPTSFTVPEVVSWQQKPDGPSPDEILSCLQVLFTNGILQSV